jgi:hypothetical protein
MPTATLLAFGDQRAGEPLIETARRMLLGSAWARRATWPWATDRIGPAVGPR